MKLVIDFNKDPLSYTTLELVALIARAMLVIMSDRKFGLSKI